MKPSMIEEGHTYENRGGTRRRTVLSIGVSTDPFGLIWLTYEEVRKKGFRYHAGDFLTSFAKWARRDVTYVMQMKKDK